MGVADQRSAGTAIGSPDERYSWLCLQQVLDWRAHRCRGICQQTSYRQIRLQSCELVRRVGLVIGDENAKRTGYSTLLHRIHGFKKMSSRKPFNTQLFPEKGPGLTVLSGPPRLICNQVVTRPGSEASQLDVESRFGFVSGYSRDRLPGTNDIRKVRVAADACATNRRGCCRLRAN
jgi:hypothetical protein